MHSNLFPFVAVEERFLIGMLNNSSTLWEHFSKKEILANWGQIGRLAEWHGLIPLLYRSMGDLSELLPAEETHSLQALNRDIAGSNLALTAHLLMLTGALKKSGLNYISIKGPALSQEIYDDISLRQYSDIDLFVDQDDMVKICNLIVSLGYEPILPTTLLRRKKFFELDNDFSFRHRVSDALLELHWKLFPERHKMPLPFSALHDRAGTLLLKKREITILSPEDNLLYLSLHGAKHIFERFEWVYDLDRLMRTYPELDLAKVHERAVEIEIEEAFLLGIFLSELLFETPIQKSLLLHRSHRTDRLIEKVLDYYEERFVFWDEAAKKRARFLFLAELHQGKGPPLYSHFKSLFKPTAVDVITFNLPDNVDFLYPLLRPFRLLYKHLIKRAYVRLKVAIS